MNDLVDLSREFANADSALIFCHVRPDGDTLGCAFALKTAMEKRGKTADIVCESPIPEKFGFFDCAAKVLRSTDVKKTYSVHIALDCSTENMLGEAYGLYARNNSTFNIDHHISNTRYAKFNYVEGSAACCEIMFSFIKYIGCEIDADVAQCLLLGISTDTGHFMHSNVTAKTLSIASELVSAGGDIHEIGYNMFKRQKKARAELYAHVISGMKFYLDGKLAVITVMKSDLERFGATSDMTEGFIDFPLSVEGVEVAVSILESRANAFKISYRSSGKVDVNSVAATFGGGGHKLASGSMLFGFYEDVKDKLVYTISTYL